MKDEKIQKLTKIAKKYMAKSNDPIHDLNHVERVVKNVKKLTSDLNINEEDKISLILAAYWHDVGRSITKKTSFIWMTMLDDIVSGVMLWINSLKNGIFFNKAVRKSIWLNFYKGLGNGNPIIKVLSSKKTRLLVDILKDADNLDILYTERFANIFNLVETSTIYHLGYKAAVWWSLKTKHLHMKTKVARKYIEEIIKKFIKWITQKIIYDWHLQVFGKKWVTKTLKNLEKLLSDIRILNLKNIYYI